MSVSEFVESNTRFLNKQILGHINVLKQLKKKSIIRSLRRKFK